MWVSPSGPASYNTYFELRRCAHWRGLTWEYFRDLSDDEQADYLAEYRAVNKLEALEMEHVRKAAEQRARRAGLHGKSRI